MLLLDRLRAPGQRAIAGAGPPWSWVIAGGLAGVLVLATLFLLGVTRGVPFVGVMLVPAAGTLVASLADRDGWAIRQALARIGLDQRARWTGRFPSTPGQARAWLDDPAHANARPLAVAAAALTAGRAAVAREALARLDPESDDELAAATRFAAVLDAEPTGTIDRGRLAAFVDRLSEPERRYHLLSEAWSQAWIDLQRRRPWRAGFAVAARGFAPYDLPRRVRIALAIQQLAAPIAVVLASLIMGPLFDALPLS